VLTLDLHAAPLQRFFRVPIDNLDALPVLAAEVERRVAAASDRSRGGGQESRPR
jgi:phosphoribosylpyrophosphate synthetase